MDNLLTTWQQGRFVDQPQYSKWTAEEKAKANHDEKYRVRPSPTGNAIAQCRSHDEAKWIASRLNLAAKLEAEVEELGASLKSANELYRLLMEENEEMRLGGLRFFDCLKRANANHEKFERLWLLRAVPLEDFAGQKLTSELDDETKDAADYEYAYNEMVKLSRKSLAETSGGDTGNSAEAIRLANVDGALTVRLRMIHEIASEKDAADQDIECGSTAMKSVLRWSATTPEEDKGVVDEVLRAIQACPERARALPRADWGYAIMVGEKHLGSGGSPAAAWLNAAAALAGYSESHCAADVAADETPGGQAENAGQHLPGGTGSPNSNKDVPAG